MYEEALRRAFEAARQEQVQLVRTQTVSDLCALTRNQGLARAALKVRRQNLAPGLAVALAERSFAERHGNPRLMTDLAELATLAAESEEVVTTALASDSRAEAWLALANAKRIEGNHFAAQDAFDTASEAIREGSGDPYLTAKRDRLLASLRSEQERRSEASQLYRRAAAQYLTLGSHHDAGRCLISTGRVQYENGEPGLALHCLVGGMELIEPGREPLLGTVALSIAVHLLAENGHANAAHTLLEEGRHLYDYSASIPATMGYKLRWMRGKLECDHGDADVGLQELREVRQALLTTDLALDTARISFELASRLVSRARSREAAELLAECLPLFVALRLPAEATVALRLLEQAVLESAFPSALVLDQIQGLKTQFLT